MTTPKKKHINKIYADGDNLYVYISDNIEESIVYSFRNYIIGNLSMKGSNFIPNHQQLDLEIFARDFNIENFGDAKAVFDFEIKKTFKKIGFYKRKLKKRGNKDGKS